jgi:ankyrin repeat protein
METQLCNAALSGELPSVQSLLKQGVNINASQEGGWTALMNATLQGHLPVVKTLIDEKADLDLKDHGGFTALMYAASYNRIQIAEELVKAGSNLDVTDNSGRTIAHYANDPQIKAAITKGQQDREAAKSPPQQMQGMPPGHMMPMGFGPQGGIQQGMGMQGFRR